MTTNQNSNMAGDALRFCSGTSAERTDSSYGQPATAGGASQVDKLNRAGRCLTFDISVPILPSGVPSRSSYLRGGRAFIASSIRASCDAVTGGREIRMNLFLVQKLLAAANNRRHGFLKVRGQRAESEVRLMAAFGLIEATLNNGDEGSFTAITRLLPAGDMFLRTFKDHPFPQRPLLLCEMSPACA